MPKTSLFIFFDESGNYDFSDNGTKHLVMSAVCTSEPAVNLKILGDLKYELLASGINIPNFHASEDVQLVRNQVFSSLERLSISAAKSFWIRKDDSRLGEPGLVNVYKQFGLAFAKWAEVRGEIFEGRKTVLMFDRVLHGKDQRAFRASTKALFGTLEGSSFVFFHSVHMDFNGQIADYIAWAHYVNLERGEVRPTNALPKRLSELDNLFDWLEAAK